MEQAIKLIPIGRKEWLKEIPDKIKTLKKGYNFYFNCSFANITNNIKEVAQKNYIKNKHKIVLYNNRKSQDWYLVVYAKKCISIYWCSEYKYPQNIIYTDEYGNPTGTTGNHSQWSAIKRFINKFSLAYEEAVNEQEKELSTNQNNN